MFLRPGNELVVTRIDRLARLYGDLQDLVREMRAKGASLRATEQPIGTSTAAARHSSTCGGSGFRGCMLMIKALEAAAGGAAV